MRALIAAAVTPLLLAVPAAALPAAAAHTASSRVAPAASPSARTVAPRVSAKVTGEMHTLLTITNADGRAVQGSVAVPAVSFTQAVALAAHESRTVDLGELYLSAGDPVVVSLSAAGASPAVVRVAAVALGGSTPDVLTEPVVADPAPAVAQAATQKVFSAKAVRHAAVSRSAHARTQAQGRPGLAHTGEGA